MNRAETIEALQSVPLFSTLSKKDLNEIAKRSEEAQIPKGAIMAQEGRMGNECFLILEGSAAVRRSYRDIATLGPGDVFGEMSLIEGQPQSLTVQMIEPSVVLVIGQQGFQELLHEVPGFAAKLLIAMSRRLREADRRVLG